MPRVARPAEPTTLTLADLPESEQAKFRLRLKELGYVDPSEIVSKVYDRRHSAKWEEGWWEGEGAERKFKRARPEQLAPPGDWMVWVYRAGRGSGKTRAGSEWIDKNARKSPSGSQVLLAGRTPADVNTYMLRGPGGLLTNHPDVRYTPSKREVEWPNGVVGIIRSGANPEEFRGFSGELAWLDEFGAWEYAKDSWFNLLFSMRERDPRILITSSARAVKIFSEIQKDPSTVVVVGHTRDNTANLAPKFMEQVVAKLEGTRLGRQELEAEMLDKIEGALWTVEMLDKRVELDDVPSLVRVVVGVDPQGVKKDGAETGIVVAGADAQGEIYILDDCSVNGTPFEWGGEVIAAYKAAKADSIVAEKNYGGEMVLQNIRAIDRTSKVEMVNATRGKIQRAEPVAALYERGLVHHVGDRDRFVALENQLCNFIPGVRKERRVDKETDEGEVFDSPNRLDALVWAVTALMGQQEHLCTSATWGRRRGRGGRYTRSFRG